MDCLSLYRSRSKSIIRCQNCKSRHYPTRNDRINLEKNKYYDVFCKCGYVYRIKDLNHTLVVSGRRIGNGE